MKEGLLRFPIRDPTFQSFKKIINTQYFYPTERIQSQQIVIAANDIGRPSTDSQFQKLTIFCISANPDLFSRIKKPGMPN